MNFESKLFPLECTQAKKLTDGRLGHLVHLLCHGRPHVRRTTDIPVSQKLILSKLRWAKKCTCEKSEHSLVLSPQFEIWLQLAQWFHRRSRLKMWRDDGRMKDNRAKLSYKPSRWAKIKISFMQRPLSHKVGTIPLRFFQFHILRFLVTEAILIGHYFLILKQPEEQTRCVFAYFTH